MADRIRDSADTNAYQLPSSSKPYLSFSIENILSEGTFGPQNQQRKVHAQKYESSRKEKTKKPSVETLFTRLPWLAYTRYCPPKIPSKQKSLLCRVQIISVVFLSFSLAVCLLLFVFVFHQCIRHLCMVLPCRKDLMIVVAIQ